MREWVRRLSFRAEFAIVILAALGLPLADSVYVLVSLLFGHYSDTYFTNAGFLRGLIFEVVVGCLLCCFLKLRGWTAADVGLSLVRSWSPTLLSTPLIAVGLVVATYAIYIPLRILAVRVDPFFGVPRLHFAPALPVLTVLAASLINASYEELFECGYVISSLRDRIGVTNAINVSAGIRVAMHLYQGPMGLLGNAPFVLICAIWFARTKRLWPLILAHFLVDATALYFGSRRG